MKKVDKEDWVNVQHKAFTAWVNSHLRKREIKIEDLASGLENGINLVNLLEELTGKTVPVSINKNPNFRIQKIQNNSIAVDFAKSEKVNITASAEDVVDGKLKNILGMIWTFILKYQINRKSAEQQQKQAQKQQQQEDQSEATSSDEQSTQQQTQSSQQSSSGSSGVKGELLSWISEQLQLGTDEKVTDFTNSWKDGKLLARLLYNLAPKHIKAKFNMDEEDPIKLLTQIITIAEEEMGIPMIVDPEDIINHPEELSMMTYISYFRDYSMEEHADEEEEPEVEIDPSQCTIELPEKFFVDERVKFFITSRDMEGNMRAEAEDEFIVVLTGPEAIEAVVTSNGDGTYDGEFIPKVGGDYKLHATVFGDSIADTPVQLRVLERAAPQHTFMEGSGVQGSVIAGKQVEFTIVAKSRTNNAVSIGGDNFEVEIVGPNNVMIQSTIRDNNDGTYTVTYTPGESGVYALSASMNGEEISGSPIVIVAKREAVPTKCVAYGPGIEGSLKLGVATSFTVRIQDENGEYVQIGGDEVTVEIQTPDGKMEPTVTDKGDGSYDVSFTLEKPGLNEISVFVNGQQIPGSPYKAVIEPEMYAPASNAEFQGCKVRYDNCMVTYNVNSIDKFGNPAKMPTNVVTVVLDENDQPVDTKLVEFTGKSYTASFKPKPHNRNYKLHLSANGVPLQNSPVHFTVEPQLDPSNCSVEGPGIEGGDLISRVGMPAFFTIRAKNTDGEEMQLNTDSDEIQRNEDLIQRLFTYQDAPVIPPTIEKKKKQRKKKGDDGAKEAEKEEKSEIQSINHTRRYTDQVEEITEEEVEVTNVIFIDPATEEEQVSENAFYAQADLEMLSSNKNSCPFVVRIQADETEEEIDPVIMKSGVNEYTVFYTTAVAGDHTISIQHDGIEIVGGPFVATFTKGIDPLRCNVSGPGMKKAYVGVPTSFEITSRDLDGREKKIGGDDFEVLVKDPRDTSLKNPVVVEDRDDGSYKVYYTPQMEGTHTVKVKGNGVELPNGNTKVLVLPKSSMPDVKRVTVNKVSPIVRAKMPASLTVTLPDQTTGGDNVEVFFDQPANSRLMKRPVIRDNNNGTYTILYEPILPGKYVAHVKVNNQEVLPAFEIKVLSSLNPSLCTIGNWNFEIGTSVPIELSELSVEYSGNNVIQVKDDKQLFVVSYDPPTIVEEEDEEESESINSKYHTLDVKYDNSSIDGAPFSQTFVQ